MPLKALKQSTKAENDISSILLNIFRWVPLTSAVRASSGLYNL